MRDDVIGTISNCIVAPGWSSGRADLLSQRLLRLASLSDDGGLVVAQGRLITRQRTWRHARRCFLDPSTAARTVRLCGTSTAARTKCLWGINTAAGTETDVGTKTPVCIKQKLVGPPEAVSVIVLLCWTLLAALLAYAYQPQSWLITAAAIGFISLLTGLHEKFIRSGAPFVVPCLSAYIDACIKINDWVALTLMLLLYSYI